MGYVVCAFYFTLLVGSGIYANMNGWRYRSRGVSLCDESSSSFKASGDV